ncbi:MAG: LacI family DNA-binding transcriptional regulator [Oscillospiraceae bacterium]|nr:LacI family DNA-binding transcriptional regulator [Oscillospiraceae bacterium]
MSTVKISDVAKAANVSSATVSRVLSNSDTVRPATREHVLAVMKKLNYQPNALAQQLRTQATKTVIVIVPDIRNLLFHEVINGIEAEAASSGYQVLLADMHGQPSVESYYVSAVQRRQVDGIISMSANMTQKLLNQIAGEYPIVMALQGFDSPSIPFVSIDNAAAARTMTAHLIKLGHRKIAHITGSAPLPYQERLSSYRAVLEENGIPYSPALVGCGEASIRGGYEQMKAMLERGEDFTAVFAAGDTMAIGAIQALQEAGRRVPQDCAVAGFDDIELSSVLSPKLTTIRQPTFQIGQQSFKMLLSLMKKEPVPNAHVLLPHELVIRDSCGYWL